MQLISSMTMWRNKDEVSKAAEWNWFQISSRLQQKHGCKRIDQGSSETLSGSVETAVAGVGGVLLVCQRPSLTRLWLSGVWLVSSSHRWPPCKMTGQHNFSGDYTRGRCFIRSHKFIFQAPLGIHNLKYLRKSRLFCGVWFFFVVACNTLWTQFLILFTEHKSLFSGIWVSIFF